MEETMRWTGIQQFNDNTRVTEYHNMIPMGDVCVDLLGCDPMLSIDINNQEPSITEFVDSFGVINILKAKDCSVRVYRYSVTEKRLLGMKYVVEGDPVNSAMFVESSVAPQRIYLLLVSRGSSRLYTWQTQDFSGGAMTNITPIVGYTRLVSTSDLSTVDYELVLANEPRITSITWFDNRLVLTDVANNVVWLSSTNFQERLDFQAAFDKMNTAEKQAVYADLTQRYRLRFYGIDTDETDSTWGDYAFPNWYSSTNNSAQLRQAISFRGQLFLFFSTIIERWYRTGIEDSPIQFDTNGTVGVGGISPVVLNDRMFFLGNDQLGNQFAGLFDESTRFVRISNSEIEQRFKNEMTNISFLLLRQDTFCVFRSSQSQKATAGLAVSSDGRWWEFGEFSEKPAPLRSIYGHIAISNIGYLCQFTEKHRLTLDGSPVLRYIRETLPIVARKRMLASTCVVTCDTGFFDGTPQEENDNQFNSLWFRLSINKGMTFGRSFFRRFGRSGQNDKTITFRNMGSGSQFTYEVGTAANVKWQVYDILLNIL